MGNKATTGGAPKYKLASNDLDEIKENTYYMNQEIALWHRQFLKEAPTGGFNKDQFFNYYQKINANNKCKANQGACDQAFKEADENGKGILGFTEFMVALWNINLQVMKKQLRLVFKKYDLNNNGSIQLAELEKILHDVFIDIGKKFEPTDIRARIPMIFNKLDKDGDNKLSESEFIEGISKDAFMRNLMLPASIAVPCAQ